MKILLLIDIQNDFCPGGALAVKNGSDIVAIANELINSGQYDLIIASQDFHPKNHKSFAINHEGKNIFEQIYLNGLAQTLWPEHCVENTYGSEFHPDLNTDQINYIVKKGRTPEIDSYSAFFDNGHKQETELDNLIQMEIAKRGVSKDSVQIDIMGLATDYCVKFSALDARSLGYNTGIIVDGCRAVNLNPDDEIKALSELSANGVEIKYSREITMSPQKELRA